MGVYEEPAAADRPAAGVIAAVDVDYRDTGAVAACVLFRDWTDAEPVAEFTEVISPIAEYVPGEFYRRELPCLMAILGQVGEPLAAVVVDGYVWLGEDRPGLGAKLFEALGGQVPVVGVAKTRFISAAATEVRHGGSNSPLYVTAAGLDVANAAEFVRRMHGPYRIPTLLKRVDQLCRRGSISPP